MCAFLFPKRAFNFCRIKKSCHPSKLTECELNLRQILVSRRFTWRRIWRLGFLEYEAPVQPRSAQWRREVATAHGHHLGHLVLRLTCGTEKPCAGCSTTANSILRAFPILRFGRLSPETGLFNTHPLSSKRPRHCSNWGTSRAFGRTNLNIGNFPPPELPFTITRVKQEDGLLFRYSWSRSGARVARVSALPLFLIGSLGWIPDKVLDVPPKGPWPWGAILGSGMILFALAGLLSARGTSTDALSINTCNCRRE